MMDFEMQQQHTREHARESARRQWQVHMLSAISRSLTLQRERLRACEAWSASGAVNLRDEIELNE